MIITSGMLPNKLTIFTLAFSWILLSGSALCQDAPAAERAFEDAVVIQKNEMGQRGTKDVKEISVPVKEKVQEKLKDKKIHKSGNKKYIDWGEFWLTALIILGLLICLGGLGTFFLFNLIGWWVLLTALGGLTVGCLVILAGEMINGGKLAGLGAFLVGVFGLIGWLLGTITVAIYNAVVN